MSCMMPFLSAAPSGRGQRSIGDAGSDGAVLGGVHPWFPGVILTFMIGADSPPSGR